MQLEMLKAAGCKPFVSKWGPWHRKQAVVLGTLRAWGNRGARAWAASSRAGGRLRVRLLAVAVFKQHLGLGKFMRTPQLL